MPGRSRIAVRLNSALAAPLVDQLQQGFGLGGRESQIEAAAHLGQ